MSRNDGEDYHLTCSRVLALLEEEGEGEDQLSESAFVTALRLLRTARRLLEGPFPRGTASAPPDGGVHVYWQQGPRHITLATFPLTSSESPRPSLYHDDGEQHAAEPVTSGRDVAKWLRWLRDET